MLLIAKATDASLVELSGRLACRRFALLLIAKATDVHGHRFIIHVLGLLAVGLSSMFWARVAVGLSWFGLLWFACTLCMAQRTSITMPISNAPSHIDYCKQLLTSALLLSRLRLAVSGRLPPEEIHEASGLCPAGWRWNSCLLVKRLCRQPLTV